MLDPSHPIAELLQRDRRYRFEAYLFVFESLRFAQEALGLGLQQSAESAEGDPRPTPGVAPGPEPREQDDVQRGERHLTGQELCEAIRLYALEQYGYMAKSVLNHWGISKTGDFGDMVFNLIEIGQMRKTSDDRREDFDDVYDFDEGLRQSFEFTAPE